MRSLHNPSKDVVIGFGRITAVDLPGSRTGYVAPGGASTVSRAKAEKWARWINRKLVDERVGQEDN